MTPSLAMGAVVAWLAIGCSNLFAEPPVSDRQLGYVTDLKAAPITSRFATQVGYSPEEKKQLKQGVMKYYSGGEFEKSITIAANFHHLKLKDYFVALMSHRERALAFNSVLLEEAESLLSGSKKRLLRRLVNQMFVRSGDVDGIVVMNELEIDFENYEKLVQVVESRWSNIPSKEVERARATISYLATQIGSDELNNALGEEYDGSLVFTKRANPSANPKTMCRLFLKPDIQTELRMTAEQAIAVTAVVKPLLEADEEEYDEGKFLALLDEAQQTRVRQLALQSDLRSMNLNSAFRAMSEFSGAKVKMERGNKSPSNWIQAEAWYAMDLRTTEAGKAAFSEVLGEALIKRLCGEFEPPDRSPWTYLDEELDDEALERAKKRVQKPKKKSANPRRTAK